MENHDLIFDIGMHHGDDAAFYLSKGFRVVSIEAFPDYIKSAKERFSAEIAGGQFKMVDKAFGEVGLKEITLYVNREKDDSHTTRSDLVALNEASQSFSYDRIVVGVVTLAELFGTYGVPYYLKCDIEGGDEEVLNQLVKDHRRPAFISFEVSNLDVPVKMRAAGYELFQVRNQWRNPMTQPPKPAFEGLETSVDFTGHMSGLFGRELPFGKWMSFENALRLFQAWLEVQKLDPDFVPGWCDFHATTVPIKELLNPNSFAL